MDKPNIINRLPLWAFLIGIAVLTSILLLPQFNPTLHGGGDNCKYISVAMSVAQGNGFRQIYNPEQPADNILSPGYIGILAGIIKLTGNPKPVIAFKYFSILSFILFLVFMAFVYVKYLKLDRYITIGLVVLMAINTTMSCLASFILTGTAFLCSMAITLIFLFEYERRESWLWLAISVVASTATVYIRFPSVLIIGGIFLWILLLKRYIHSIAYLICSALIISPRLITTLFKQGGYGGGGNFLGNLISVRIPKIFSVSWGYFFGKLPNFMFSIHDSGFPPQETPIGATILAIFIIITGIIGLVITLRDKRLRLMGLLFLSLALTYSVMTRPLVRYVSHFALFFLYFSVVGIQWIIKETEIKKRGGIITWSIIFLILLVSLIPKYVQHVTLYSQARGFLRARRFLRENGYKDDILPWNMEKSLFEYHEALRFCRNNTKEDAIIIVSKPHIAFIVSDRQAITDGWVPNKPGSGFQTADSSWEFLLDAGATYAVLDPFRDYFPAYFNSVLNEYSNCLQLIYRSSAPPSIMVIEIDTTCIRNMIRRKRAEAISSVSSESSASED